MRFSECRVGRSWSGGSASGPQDTAELHTPRRGARLEGAKAKPEWRVEITLEQGAERGKALGVREVGKVPSAVQRGVEREE